MTSRYNYDQFSLCLDLKRLIPITKNLLDDYKKYYDKYPEHKDIDFNTFYSDFSSVWHRRDEIGEDLQYYRETVFPLIENAEVGPNVYINLLERQATDAIEQVIAEGFDQAKIGIILKELDDKKSQYINKDDNDIFKIDTLDLSVLDSSNGLSWFLPSLQSSLGSHMAGQFIVVAADSNAGKSAFCISQAVHVFEHLHKAKIDRPILYCTSEDTKEDLAGRFLSNLYKDKVHGGFEQIVADWDKVSKHYAKTYDPELFIGMQIRSNADLFKIRKKIDKYNPSIIIVDMLDKLSASDAIIDLTKLYQDVRGIANDGYPILGTSQTGNTSYQDKNTGEFKHRKHLKDKDLANSKSGKQGAAYCMIMIGMDDDMPGVRYVSTTKKKRGSHVSTTCTLNEQFSLYRELL
jgi:hypothetical protein